MAIEMIVLLSTMIWTTGDDQWWHDFSTQTTKNKGLTTKCQQRNWRVFCVYLDRKVSALKDVCRKVLGNTIFSHDLDTRTLYRH